MKCKKIINSVIDACLLGLAMQSTAAFALSDDSCSTLSNGAASFIVANSNSSSPIYLSNTTTTNAYISNYGTDTTLPPTIQPNHNTGDGSVNELYLMQNGEGPCGSIKFSYQLRDANGTATETCTFEIDLESDGIPKASATSANGGNHCAVQAPYGTEAAAYFVMQ